MRTETLLRAIGKIDDDLIERAERRRGSRKLLIRRIALVAAVCAILVGVIAMAAPREEEQPTLRIYAPVDMYWLERAINCFCYYERRDALVLLNYRDTDFQNGAYYYARYNEHYQEKDEDIIDCNIDLSHGLPNPGDWWRREQNVDEYRDISREVLARGAADIVFFYGCIYGGQCRYSIDFSSSEQLEELTGLARSKDALGTLLTMTADAEGKSYAVPLAVEEYDGGYYIKVGLVVSGSRPDPQLVGDFLEYLAENVEGFEIAEPQELSPLQAMEQTPDARCIGLTPEPKPVNLRGQAAGLLLLILASCLCWVGTAILLVRAIRAWIGWYLCREKCRGPLVFHIPAKRAVPLIGLGVTAAAVALTCYIHRLDFGRQADVARWLFLLILSVCGLVAVLFASMLAAKIERYGDRILFETGLSFTEYFTDELERAGMIDGRFTVIPKQGKPITLRKELFSGLEEAAWLEEGGSTL